MPGAVCVGGVDGVILLTIIYAQSNFICLLTCSTPSSILVVLKVQAASKLFMYIWVFHTLDICPVPPASFIMAKAGFIQVIFLWWKIVGHRSVAYNSGVFEVTISIFSGSSLSFHVFTHLRSILFDDNEPIIPHKYLLLLCINYKMYRTKTTFQSWAKAKSRLVTVTWSLNELKPPQAKT